MNIAIEKRIPYIADALSESDNISFWEASEFTAEALCEVEVIIIRTTVKCDAALLEGTAVRLILTATIGYDHIDTAYCSDHGIIWKNAPGCNADSVVQYFLSSLASLGTISSDSLSSLTVGVIGCGNVGSRIVSACRLLGMNVLVNDPPLQRKGGCVNGSEWSSLDDIARLSDVVTVHTPLIREGDFPTVDLLSDAFFDSCARKPVIFNTARGGVIDESALLTAYSNGKIGAMVIDCWKGEPNIDRALLQASAIHTPHIAGYSADGKANATRMCLNNLVQYGYSAVDFDRIHLPEVSEPILVLSENDSTDPLVKALLHCYDVRKDSLKLEQYPDQFRRQRDEYPFRRESRAYTISEKSGVRTDLWTKLGFKTV